MPKAITIGVPPGIGDSYWVMTKLQAFRKVHGIDHVTLAVQKTSKDRAGCWHELVDFVDETRFVHFIPDVDQRGFSMPSRIRGFDAVMWPNSVVDRGYRLEAWMPELPIDLDFKIHTPLAKHSGAVVLYASALGVNRAWLPNLGPAWWVELAKYLAEEFKQRPLLIGAPWDIDFCAPLLPHVDSVLGDTTLPEVLAIIEEARVVVGLASGMTIMANHFRTPAIAFFPNKHNAQFPRTWVAPNAPYIPLFARELDSLEWHPQKIAIAADALVENSQPIACEP